MNVILGELGFMGRLGQRVRDKEGLAYSCTSFLNSGLAGGSWTALAGVNPRNIAKASVLMKEEIERVRQELVEEQELADAKQNQLGSALMELESTEGIARTSHNLAHFGLGLDYFVKRRQLFGKITREDLMEMARKYLDSSRLSTVIVGPRLKSSLPSRKSRLSLGSIDMDDPATEVTIDEFKRLEMRVGTVVEVSRVPRTNKLYKVVVDLGTHGKKQTATSLVDFYNAEDLLHKRVIFLANLKPTTFAGQKSEGMLLAASEGEKLALLGIERDVPDGSRVS